MARFLFSMIIMLSGALVSQHASAQIQTTNDRTLERINRLERDLLSMQQQVTAPAPAPIYQGNSGSSSGAIDPASLEVRLSELETQIRELRGRVEQSENMTFQVQEQIDLLKKDVEFRFTQLESQGGSDTAIQPIQPVVNAPAEAAVSARSFSTPREHYNYAFRLLNQGKYEDAADSFYQFIVSFPNDPLVGNAWYWGGESHYIRRDYLGAADIFRQGFEAMPEGPKAADNLFKLALSLNALDRRSEACVVLQQVVSLFKRTATNVVNKAEQELKNYDCRKN